MPFTDWRDEHCIGVERLDRDHKRLLGLLKRLHDAVASGHGLEVLARTLSALDIYMKFHFAEEEELFLRTNYPSAEAHQREHRDLTAKLEEIRQQFEKYHSDALPQKVLEFLNGWFHYHNLGADRVFADYLKANRYALELRDNSASTGGAQ